MSCNEDNDNDISQATTSSGREKKEYSVKFKLQVVEWAKLNRNSDRKPNKHAAAKHFGVPRQNIRRWILQSGDGAFRRTRAEDAAGNDSDVSVISAEDQAAEECEEFEEEEDSDSDFCRR